MTAGDAGAGAPPASPLEAGRPITSWRVLAIAAPVALSNTSVALQGAVDTAVIGNIGDVTALAAVGLGAIIFSLILGSLNFLQIGVSGLTAQALGAGNRERIANILLRGLLLAGGFAAALILLQAPLTALGLTLFEASPEAEALAATYFAVRILGAPAELMNYVLMGWFTGQEMTRRLFQHQLVVSASNILLNILFVLGFGWGIVGVAAATVLASVMGLGYGLWLARRRIRALLPPEWRPERARVLKRDELIRMMALNRDIFIRTLLLIGAFAWMTRLGSLQGDVTLAANVVLFELFHVSAYALDGFAIAAETLVGQALGRGDKRRLDQAAAITSLWSGMLAAGIALGFWLLSGPLIDLFAAAPEVRAEARIYALWMALIPLAGFPSFQLDGIFVGATGSVEMRNAMIVSSALYLPISLWLMDLFGNHGVWAALYIWLGLRALSLLAYYPRIRARAVGV